MTPQTTRPTSLPIGYGWHSYVFVRIYYTLTMTPPGFEPGTRCLEGSRSDPLSYGAAWAQKRAALGGPVLVIPCGY